MSVHEGVSCDACSQSNFRSKRFKCLICFDYDLCSTCYEQGNTSSQHTPEHPMQCILTRQDFDFYYRGETCTSELSQSLTCPLCGEMGFAFPFLNESSSLHSQSSQNVDLFQHLQLKHADNPQTHEVICPICASTISGEPNFVTGDLIAHVANDHQHSHGSTPSSAGSGTMSYLRQSVPGRDYDFGLGSGARGNAFRRGSSRMFGRRGTLGRGGGPASQHFVVSTSSGSPITAGGNDPFGDLLSQLTNVRRLASASNGGSSANPSTSSVLNTINLQTITRQQYERERLRTAARLHHSQQAAASADKLPSAELDLFDSLFTSNRLIDSLASSALNDQTWAHVVAPSQSTPEQPSQTSSALKPPTAGANTEADPSLLRRLCKDSSSSTTQQSGRTAPASKSKTDFVQSLLLSSFVHPINDQ